MSEKFKGKYQVVDGYVGGDRPQYLTIHAGDIEDDMTDAQLVEMYEGEIQQHFEDRISPSAERVDEFVAWAREQLQKRAG